MVATELSQLLESARFASLGDLPSSSLVTPTELAELRSGLAERLRSVAGDLPAGVELRISRGTLRAGIECPGGMNDAEFAWSAPFAARRLGLEALRATLASDHVSLTEAVRSAIDDALSNGGPFGLWLRSQGAGARAATAATATSWVARALVSFPWTAVGRVRLCGAATWYRPLGRGAPVILVGRPDAVVLQRGPRALECILIRIGRPDSSIALLDALVATLASGRAPLRTVSLDPASGQIQAIDVNAAVLRSAADLLVELATVLAVPLRDQRHTCSRGPHCRTCPGSGRCE